MENINICSLINNISNEKNEEIKEKMKNELILRIFEKGREIDFLKIGRASCRERV